MSRLRRQKAWTRGRRAETLAALWLRCKGYRVLARDFRSPVGEIDLVARRGATLAIVEVKARSSLAEAGEAISPRQRRRIRNAAIAFLQRHPSLGTLDLRFDAILMVPRHWPRHLTDAWRDESRF